MKENEDDDDYSQEQKAMGATGKKSLESLQPSLNAKESHKSIAESATDKVSEH